MFEFLRRAGADNRRSDERFSIYLPARMMWGGHKIDATILDVSAGGALVHRHGDGPPDGFVWLTAGGHEAAARVKWTRGDRLGLQFVHPLRQEQLKTLIARGHTGLPR